MLRDARPADFETLYRIDQRCFVPGISYSRLELRHYMQEQGAFTVVAEQDGEISGFLVGGVVSSPTLKKLVGHIITIDLLPEFRRSGIGTLLMDEAERRILAAGADLVRLEVAVDNEPALAFYQRRGYRMLKTIPRYYMNSIDAFVLGKVLK